MINVQKAVRRTGADGFGDTFSGYHPFVNMLYFVAVIGFAMFFTHPVCLAISLFCAFTYSVAISRKKAFRFTFLYMLPLLVVTAVLSPLFNHQGATILTYFPGGNPLTLESILYGIAAAMMLITVVTWFSCFNEVMSSDKFIYLFGRIIPALSLVFSMALRFVPRFIAQTKVISNAQKCVGRDVSGVKILRKTKLGLRVFSIVNLFRKMKHGVKILSILVTWSLENAIETADSMKGRGYGLAGRTAFSIYRFDKRDLFALVYIVACAATVISGAVVGAYQFRYFPTIKGEWTGTAIVVFAAYFALGVFPVFMNIKETAVLKRINV